VLDWATRAASRRRRSQRSRVMSKSSIIGS
jgi:hypothetical protein